VSKLDAERLVTRLEPHLARLSAVFAILPEKTDTEEQKLLARRLRAQGLAYTPLVVDEALVRAIRAREALAW
jgi:hypothetical protein